MTNVLLMPGDGIGPEVIGAARRVLEALSLSVILTEVPVGFGAYQEFGESLPESTLKAVREADAILFGAVTTPALIENYKSPVLRLRKELDLYANVRPIRSMMGNSKSQKTSTKEILISNIQNSKYEGIDMVIFRENTECLYAGIEERTHDEARTVRLITRKGSERIIRVAFEYVRLNGRKKVTVVHKANVLRATCGLFLEVAREVAGQFPDIHLEEMIVDRCAMELIRDPLQFDVIVTTNLFGDILSDEASALVGGLGVAPSANLGENIGLFEPVHGSAPDIAGKGIANPFATFLAMGMMLDWLGREKKEKSKEKRWEEMFREVMGGMIGKRECTVDLGGGMGTEKVTEEFVKNLKLKI